MKKEDEIQLLNELVNVLERQLEFARHGEAGETENLIGCGEQLAFKITAAGLLERPEYDHWRNRLTELYKNLELVFSAQKQAVAEQMKSIQMSKKTLAAYSGSV
jgi:hypothetical protein